MPTIRGSAIGSSSAGSYVISLPAGAIAGDTGVVFVGGGYGVKTAPSGWTVLDNSKGSNFNGFLATKVLDAADITAGSITIVMDGSYYSVWAIVVFEGLAYVGMPAVARNGSGASSIALSSNNDISTGDLVLLWGSNRATDNVTIDHGAAIQAINANTASGALYGYTSPDGAVVDATISYSSSGSGNYQAIATTSDNPIPTYARATNVVVLSGEKGTGPARATNVQPMVLERGGTATGSRATQYQALVVEQLKRPTHARSTQWVVLTLDKLREDTLIDYQDRAIRRLGSAVSLARFIDLRAPDDLASYPCHAIPRWSDRFSDADSGDTLVSARWSDPLMRFTLPDAIRDQASLEAVRDHWLVMRGPAHTWPFANPLDYSSAALTDDFKTTISDADQTIGAGDGRKTRFQLIKKYARGAQSYLRPIVLPRTETVIVSIDGTRIGRQHYSVSRRGGVIEFDAPPALGAIIRAGFLFEHEVRYDGDDGFEAMQNEFAASGYAAITLVEVRGTRNG